MPRLSNSLPKYRKHRGSGQAMMAQAAIKHSIEPRTISFKGALQFLEEFQRLIDYLGHRGTEFRQDIYQCMLDCMATHRVADRPGRFEPRLMKRRPKEYFLLQRPRHEEKLDIIKRLKKT